MYFGRLFLIIIGIVFLSSNFGYGFVIRFSEERRNVSAPVTQSQYFLTCKCDGETKKQIFDKERVDEIFQSILDNDFCDHKQKRICSWVQQCKSCRIQVEKCATHPDPELGYVCTRKTFEIRNNPGKNKTVKLQTTGLPEKLNRNRRQTFPKGCAYPLHMKTVSMSFAAYPSSLSVKLKCIYGHTFKEGISREVRCLYSENKWKPSGFEECKPFVDCTISLISPGRSECTTGTTTKVPTCQVTCDNYEFTTGSPTSTHECQIDGGWQPKLPLCAAPGTGVALVPAPKIKHHPLEEKELSEKSNKTEM